MQNHPHDSICGCSIDPVHREMMIRFGAAEDVGRSVIDRALEAIVPSDDRAAGDDRALVIFNPSPFRRSGVVEADVRFHLQDIVVGLNPDVVLDPKRPGPKGFVLKDARGRRSPSSASNESRNTTSLTPSTTIRARVMPSGTGS